MANMSWGSAAAGRRISAMAREQKIQKFDCGIHALTYEAYSAGCPACKAERDMLRMRDALRETKGKLEVAYAELSKLRVQTDIASAIREAAALLDDNDLAFLKATLYEWRDTKALALKTTHGARKRKRENPAPNGFIVMPRKGEPYGHLCSSVGGLAIAEYFDEATNSVGPANAMTLLTRGMAPHLPGAAR